MTLTSSVSSVTDSSRNSSLYIENIVKSESDMCVKKELRETHIHLGKIWKELYLKAILQACIHV